MDQRVEPLRCTVELLLAREHTNCTLKPTMCLELRNWRMLRHRTMCSGLFDFGLHHHDVRPSHYAALTHRLHNTLSTTLALMDHSRSNAKWTPIPSKKNRSVRYATSTCRRCSCRPSMDFLFIEACPPMIHTLHVTSVLVQNGTAHLWTSQPSR